MVKRYFAEECKSDEEIQYVTYYDYAWEAAKVDRLQIGLREALRLINISTSERHKQVEELTALANLPRNVKIS